MLKGFKDFIMRGNIVELAVAFVMGTAFATLVKTFTDAIITPILNAFPGASSNGLGFALRGGSHHDATFINLSTIINAIIVFLITAAVLYYLFVVPLERLKARTAPKEQAQPEIAEEIRLLQEIRDALRSSGSSSTSTL